MIDLSVDPWLISDTHFFHKNIVKYCDRPFKTVEQMNDTMIVKWNAAVNPDDLVIHLGDFSFGGTKVASNIKTILNGKIQLITGNHDVKSCAFDFPSLFDYKDQQRKYYFRHIPHDRRQQEVIGSYKEFEKLPDGYLFFHGHTHNSTPKFTPGAINMSVEHWNYTPTRLSEVVKQYKEWKLIQGIN